MWKSRWIGVSLILLATCLAGTPASRAQSDESVADAARRAREQKKAAAKPSTVITNDTLKPESSPTPAAQGATAAPTANPEASAATPSAEANLSVSAAAGEQKPAADAKGSAPGSQPTAEEQAAQQGEIEALKREVLEKQKELDLALRSLSLANEDFYSKPDFSKDSDGKAKLDAMKSDVDQLKDALAQLKAKLPAGISLEPEKPQPSGEAQAQQPQPQP
jgi:hypothetical protein